MRRLTRKATLMASLSFSAVLLALVLPAQAHALTVTFNDAGLEAAVRAELGISSPTPVTDTDMALMTMLDAKSRAISDLTGLEYAVNLTSLDLSDNSISDISKVSGLTNLIFLYVSSNQISDLTPVASIPNLENLFCNHNNVSDVSPLLGLNRLILLDLAQNNISNVTPLATCTSLRWVYLQDNSIVNALPLACISPLEYIDLTNNHVDNVSLFGNLKNLVTLHLANNDIRDVSGLGGCVALTDLQLGYNLIGDVSGFSTLTNLTHLELNDNLLTSVGGCTGLSSLVMLLLDYNYLDITPGSTAMTQIATIQSHGTTVLYSSQHAATHGVGAAPGTNVSVAVPGGGTLVFDTVTGAGAVQLIPTTISTASGPGFQVVTGTCFDIIVTATFTGGVEIALPYNENALPAGTSESDLRLWHRTSGGTLQDITTYVDTANNVIHGRTTSFSDFWVEAPYSPPVTVSASARLTPLGWTISGALLGLLLLRRSRRGSAA